MRIKGILKDALGKPVHGVNMNIPGMKNTIYQQTEEVDENTLYSEKRDRDVYEL